MYEVGGEAVKPGAGRRGSDADRGPDLQILWATSAPTIPSSTGPRRKRSYYRVPGLHQVSSSRSHAWRAAWPRKPSSRQMDRKDVDDVEAAAAAAKFANESPFPRPRLSFLTTSTVIIRGRRSLPGLQPEGLADPGLIEPPASAADRGVCWEERLANRQQSGPASDIRPPAGHRPDLSILSGGSAYLSKLAVSEEFGHGAGYQTGDVHSGGE